MTIPGTTGTDKSLQQMAVMVAVQEAPTSVATATASTSTTSAVTINSGQGIITSPSLTSTTAYSLIVTNSLVSAGDIVWIGLQNGTNTAVVQASAGIVSVSTGSFSVLLNNTQTTAHNGTIQITFEIVKMLGLNVVD